MEAKDYILTDLIGKADSIFYVPLYQRKYTWESKKQIKQLWEDLNEFNKIQKVSNNKTDYFLGSLIIKKSNNLNSRLILVDGQQRITTILLLVAALIDCSNKQREIDEFIKLQDLIRSNEGKFKLERINDNDIIKKILESNSSILSEVERKSNYYKNFEFFVNEIKKINNKNDEFIKVFYRNVLEKIKVAIINLNESEDEYSIFESINSKGKSLTPADLIKNYISMKIEKEEDVLKNFDNNFIGSFDKYSDPEKIIVDFYRQIVAIYDGNLYPINGKTLYFKFKDMIEEKYNECNNVIEFIKYLEIDKVIWDYVNLNEWKSKWYPLFRANKYNFYAIIHIVLKSNGIIDNNQFKIRNQKNIDWALDFLTRLSVARTLCSFGRIEGNRTYASIAHKLAASIEETNDFVESFKKVVINELESSNKNYRMPKWEEISDIEAKKDLYSNKSGYKHILIAIEEYLNNNKKIDDKKMSVEHIFPQKSDEWKKAIKEHIVTKYDSWDEMHDWLHTLGNLSIIDDVDNSALSNKPLSEKQKILEERSYLKINRHIYEHSEWTIEAIKSRATKILEYIKEIWFTNL